MINIMTGIEFTSFQEWFTIILLVSVALGLLGLFIWYRYRKSIGKTGLWVSSRDPRDGKYKKIDENWTKPEDWDGKNPDIDE